MNLYEKRLAQLERKTAKIKYILTRIPITDTAKKAFGMYEFSNREMRDPNFRILKANKGKGIKKKTLQNLNMFFIMMIQRNQRKNEKK